MGKEPHPGAFSIEEAQERFEELLARAAAGEEVIIVRGDGAVRLVAVEPSPVPMPKRVAGKLKGRISIGPEFFEPLSEEELKLWEGGDDEL
jgi:prevent-host-death family protein